MGKVKTLTLHCDKYNLKRISTITNKGTHKTALWCTSFSLTTTNELTFYIMTIILTALSFIVRLLASSTSKFVKH